MKLFKTFIIMLILAALLCAGTAETTSAEETSGATYNGCIQRILEEFGDADYISAYNKLAAGNVIKSGTNDVTATAMLKLVYAFGEDSIGFGTIGAKSLAKLNSVQEKLGLVKTEALALDGYTRLLACLYIYKYPDKCEELLKDGMGDEYWYLRGCVYQMNGDYISAKKAFLQSGIENSDERALELTRKTWPETGEIYRNSSYVGENMYIAIDMYNNTGMACAVKICNEAGTAVSVLFIQENGKAIAKLPGGVYMIKSAIGEDWYGLDNAFGEDGTYSIMRLSDDGNTYTFEEGYAYTISLKVDVPIESEEYTFTSIAPEEF